MALAALITWVITAGLGFFMLGTWISNGGTRTDGSAASHFRPPVVFGHFLLAALGLLVWVVYVINDSQGLAWVAFVDLVVVAGLGDTLVYRWFKDRQAGDAGQSGSSGLRRPGAGGSRGGCGGRREHSLHPACRATYPAGGRRHPRCVRCRYRGPGPARRPQRGRQLTLVGGGAGRRALFRPP